MPEAIFSYQSEYRFPEASGVPWGGGGGADGGITTSAIGGVAEEAIKMMIGVGGDPGWLQQ